MHPDRLLCVQNGTMFCFFGEDAKLAAKILPNSTLREQNNLSKLSFKSEFLHSHEMKLTKEKLEICRIEEVETQEAFKNRLKLSKNEEQVRERAVTAIVNSAIHIDWATIPDESEIFWSLCISENNKIGMCAVNLMDGTFRYKQLVFNKHLFDLLLVYDTPSFVIYDDECPTKIISLINSSVPAALCKSMKFKSAFAAEEQMDKIWGANSDSNSNNKREIEKLVNNEVIRSIGAAIDYLIDCKVPVNVINLLKLMEFSLNSTNDNNQKLMMIDAEAVQQLNIIGPKTGSLLQQFKCHTKCGLRQLKCLLIRPVYDIEIIQAKQVACEFIMVHEDERNAIEKCLRSLPSNMENQLNFLKWRKRSVERQAIKHVLRTIHDLIDGFSKIVTLSKEITNRISTLNPPQYLLNLLTYKAGFESAVELFVQSYDIDFENFKVKIFFVIDINGILVFNFAVYNIFKVTPAIGLSNDFDVLTETLEAIENEATYYLNTIKFKQHLKVNRQLSDLNLEISAKHFDKAKKLGSYKMCYSV